MKKFYDIRSEKGVALITVVLMTTLVVGLIALVLTDSRVGGIVTNAYVTDRKNEECGRGNLEMAEAMFVFLADKGQTGLQASKAKELDIQYVDTNLLNEIDDGIGTVSATTTTDHDTAESTPDITILPEPVSETATTTGPTPERNCSTNVDIDFLYVRKSTMYTEQVNPDLPLQGTICDDGSVYAINTVATDARTNMVREFRSAYYKCPERS